MGEGSPKSDREEEAKSARAAQVLRILHKLQAIAFGIDNIDDADEVRERERKKDKHYHVPPDCRYGAVASHFRKNPGDAAAVAIALKKAQKDFNPRVVRMIFYRRWDREHSFSKQFKYVRWLSTVLELLAEDGYELPELELAWLAAVDEDQEHPHDYRLRDRYIKMWLTSDKELYQIRDLDEERWVRMLRWMKKNLDTPEGESVNSLPRSLQLPPEPVESSPSSSPDLGQDATSAHGAFGQRIEPSPPPSSTPTRTSPVKSRAGQAPRSNTPRHKAEVVTAIEHPGIPSHFPATNLRKATLAQQTSLSYIKTEVAKPSDPSKVSPTFALSQSQIKRSPSNHSADHQAPSGPSRVSTSSPTKSPLNRSRSKRSASAHRREHSRHRTASQAPAPPPPSEPTPANGNYRSPSKLDTESYHAVLPPRFATPHPDTSPPQQQQHPQMNERREHKASAPEPRAVRRPSLPPSPKTPPTLAKAERMAAPATVKV